MSAQKPRSLLVPGLLLAALALMTFLVSFGAFLSGRYEVTRFSSPGGEFTAVVTSRRYESLVMRAPGSGSDKPGALEIFKADDTSCGRTELPMLSLARDVRWELELEPRSATVIGTATWNLDDCSVKEW
ncbi:MAG: hypothetical protein GQE15_25995 [Archangiaceae bacterium]|nr:hypothetical protein [Archangiaceae bacterium]